MPSNRLREALEHVRRALAPAGGGLTDAQLLTRFVAERDEGAFAALVDRHGPMVLGVCRRVLRDHHDAEDAFQATFLALARKALSLRRREAVAGWLYEVAYSAAVEAGRARARRGRERQVGDMPHPEVQPTEPPDWRPVLDRELAGLPEKYRAAIVLCDLEGRSRREAARQLGLAEGTLSSRLATGRRMLAERLSRAGVVLSGGALAGALSQGVASAQVPAALVSATAQAAAGGVAASPPAAALMGGVVRARFLAKLAAVALWLLPELGWCCGLALSQYNTAATSRQVAALAREGARYASVRGAQYAHHTGQSAATSQTVSRYVSSLAAPLDPKKLKVATVWKRNTVTVTVTYDRYTMTSTSVLPITN
jgi:RNA polymerase sigma factor (sigma-70 family)